MPWGITGGSLPRTRPGAEQLLQYLFQVPPRVAVAKRSVPQGTGTSLQSLGHARLRRA
jgi:hypothetical protein